MLDDDVHMNSSVMLHHQSSPVSGVWHWDVPPLTVFQVDLTVLNTKDTQPSMCPLIDLYVVKRKSKAVHFTVSSSCLLWTSWQDAWLQESCKKTSPLAFLIYKRWTALQAADEETQLQTWWRLQSKVLQRNASSQCLKSLFQTHPLDIKANCTSGDFLNDF